MTIESAAQVRDISDACYEGALAAQQCGYPRLTAEAFEAAELLRILASDIDESLPVDPAELSDAVAAANELVATTAECRIMSLHLTSNDNDDWPTPPTGAPALRSAA
jgi:hypothetical protein